MPGSNEAYLHAIVVCACRLIIEETMVALRRPSQDTLDGNTEADGTSMFEDAALRWRTQGDFYRGASS